MMLTMPGGEICEQVPGLDGAVKLEELVVQKIWAEQNFLTDSLQTSCSKKIYIDYPGRWNHTKEGPDFINARLVVDGQIRTGDVEVQFHPNEWNREGHQKDQNFENVILQVCLFTDPKGKVAQSRLVTGGAVPALILLPHLFYGIEEYAEMDAVAQLAGVDRAGQLILDELAALSKEEVDKQIKKRWMQKRAFAHARLKSQGWEQACHQWFLEVLGYRRNRAPMARVAHRFPVPLWQRGQADPQSIFASENDWNLKGCRPANHPGQRLAQYKKLWDQCPEWINRLALMQELIDRSAGTFSRKEVFPILRAWRKDVLGDLFSSSKSHTLFVDFGLPMLAEFFGFDGLALWRQWPAGDCPDIFREWAAKLGWVDSSGKRPLTNGQVQCFIETLCPKNTPQQSKKTEHE